MSYPEWFKHASPNAKITAKDFAEVLGIKPSTFWLHLKIGKIPPPDTKHIVGNALGKTTTYVNKTFWNINTVKKHIKEKDIV